MLPLPLVFSCLGSSLHLCTPSPSRLPRLQARFSALTPHPHGTMHILVAQTVFQVSLSPPACIRNCPRHSTMSTFPLACRAMGRQWTGGHWAVSSMRCSLATPLSTLMGMHSRLIGDLVLFLCLCLGVSCSQTGIRSVRDICQNRG